MSRQGPAQGKLIIFSAPSGAGKTTLLRYAARTFPRMVYSISATTRPPRPREREGVDYFFCTPDTFKQKITNNEFAEWRMVHDHYYGTPRDYIEENIREGRHVILDIDVHGKKLLDPLYPGSVGILILPPSLEVLEKRLRRRGTESEKTIALRLANARREIEFARREGNYQYTIINDSLARAKQQVYACIAKEIR